MLIYFFQLKKGLRDKSNKNRASLMWLSWLGLVYKAKGHSLIQFSVHAWAAGSVLGLGVSKRQLVDVSLSHQCFSPSLSLFLHLSLKTNLNVFKIKTTITTKNPKA